MMRKRGKKSRNRLVSLGFPEEKKPIRPKKRVRKPKMPARIKKNQTHKRKM